MIPARSSALLGRLSAASRIACAGGLRAYGAAAAAATKEDAPVKSEVLENIVAAGDAAEQESRRFANIESVSSKGTTVRWYKRASVEMVLPANAEGMSYTVNPGGKPAKEGVKPGAFSGGLTEGVQYRVLLDDKAILTVMKNKLWAPSLPLAAAVAAEWDLQGRCIRPHTMPLMTLCMTVLDHVPEVRQTMIGYLLQHLQTDSVCYRAAPTKESDLYVLQQKLHQPLVEWFQDKFQVPLTLVEDGRLDCPSHPEYTMDTIRWLLHSLTDWELEGLFAMAGTVRSLVIALATMDNQITVKEAVRLGRLEEIFQVERNGQVVAGHDLEEVDLDVRYSSAAMFTRLVRRAQKEE